MVRLVHITAPAHRKDRRVVLVAVLIALIASPTVEAAWLQNGGTAARTGEIVGGGPATDDIAFQVALPGTPLGTTAIEDGMAYLGTGDRGVAPHLADSAFWRIDLATAEVTRLFSAPPGFPLLPGPDLVVYGNPKGGSPELVAVDVATGTEKWRSEPFAGFAWPAVEFEDIARVEDTLYIAALMGQRASDLEDYSETHGYANVGVAAVDVATGDVRWTWGYQGDDGETGIQAPTLPLPASQDTFYGGRISVGGGRVFPYFVAEVATGVEGGYVDSRTFRLWALDADDGGFLWGTSDTPRRTAETPVGTAPGTDAYLDYNYGGLPAITDDAVFIRLDQFLALNPATGVVVWDSDVGQSDQVGVQGASALGVRGDVVIACTAQTIHRFDASKGDLVWRKTYAGDPDKIFSVSPVGIDGTTAYVPTARGNGTSPLQTGIDAFDLETGELRWSWMYTPTVGPAYLFTSRAAFGEGVMARGASDGVVTVLGDTGASIAPPGIATRYPGVDADVRVDLSGGRPGVHGPATRFRAEWGDGTVTEWQSEPLLSHRYATAGTAVARFQVGNDRNQTGSVFATFEVGASRPNLVSTLFDNEHQELTFFVLGLVLSGLGASVGLLRLRRRRALLARELKATERAVHENKADPLKAERLLGERLAHARVLHLKGRLHDSQFAVLESRITALGRDLRTGMIDERFDFLPRGLSRRLESILADRAVSEWEVEAFDLILDADPVLTRDQKTQVRDLIHQWAAADKASAR